MEKSVIFILYGCSGLVVGSLLNSVIYRFPHGLSIISPRSYCPKCGHVLSPMELIPVLSFLFLKGRCRKCKKTISWRYPGIEILTGILFILIYLFQDERLLSAILLDFSFVALLLCLSFIDIDCLRLPNFLVALVALIGLFNMLLTGSPSFSDGVLGAVSAGGLFLILYFFYPQGIGFGDVKFVAALGLNLGLKAVLAAVFIASLLGIVIEFMKVLSFRKNLKQPIPFGPYLAAGAMILFFFEKYVMNFIIKFLSF